MMYKTLGDIHKAMWTQIKKCQAEVGADNFDAQKQWHKKDHTTAELLRLNEVYHDAFDNPPDGVIGVGAITYAEQKLLEAQK